MITTIVVIDQLLWRPLVAWAEKFKLEQTEGKDNPTSWVLDLLQRSYILAWFSDHVGRAIAHFSEQSSVLGADFSATIAGHTPAPAKLLLRIGVWIVAGLVFAWFISDAIDI